MKIFRLVVTAMVLSMAAAPALANPGKCADCSAPCKSVKAQAGTTADSAHHHHGHQQTPATRDATPATHALAAAERAVATATAVVQSLTPPRECDCCESPTTENRVPVLDADRPAA